MVSHPDVPVRPVHGVERGLEKVSALLGGLSVLAVAAALLLMVAWLFAFGVDPGASDTSNWVLGLGGAIGRALLYALLFHAGSYAFAYMASSHRMKRLELESQGVAIVPDEARCPRCTARVLPHDRGCRKCNFVFERTLAEATQR